MPPWSRSCRSRRRGTSWAADPRASLSDDGREIRARAYRAGEWVARENFLYEVVLPLRALRGAQVPPCGPCAGNRRPSSCSSTAATTWHMCARAGTCAPRRERWHLAWHGVRLSDCIRMTCGSGDKLVSGMPVDQGYMTATGRSRKAHYLNEIREETAQDGRSRCQVRSAQATSQHSQSPIW